MNPLVLSHYQVGPLLAARKLGQTMTDLSLDLGQSFVSVTLGEDGVYLPDNYLPDKQQLTWHQLEQIAQNENACFVVEEGEIDKIQAFSAEFNRIYTLYPTASAPTMLISGIPMHRIKETDPKRDTAAKIKAAGPFTGPVLDTSTGLGYTATAAARTAQHVTTIELDPTVLEICRLNPWSQSLFDNPRIDQKIGDSADVIEAFSDESFSQIVHDPPMLSLAGHLYSSDYYRQLWRILRTRGKLFHYIGNPDSKSGKTTTSGVLRRLDECGFTRIRRVPRAFGVVANKR